MYRLSVSSSVVSWRRRGEERRRECLGEGGGGFGGGSRDTLALTGRWEIDARPGAGEVGKGDRDRPWRAVIGSGGFPGRPWPEGGDEAPDKRRSLWRPCAWRRPRPQATAASRAEGGLLFTWAVIFCGGKFVDVEEPGTGLGRRALACNWGHAPARARETSDKATPSPARLHLFLLCFGRIRLLYEWINRTVRADLVLYPKKFYFRM